MNPKNSTIAVDISTLQSGIYIVTIESEGKMAANKLIKI